MSVNEKMTAIADAIRDKTGGTESLGLDDMATEIPKVYEAGQADKEEVFWKAITADGTRTNTQQAFCNWRSEYIRPKLNGKDFLIQPTSSSATNQTFTNNTALKIVESKHFDFSKKTRGTGATKGSAGYDFKSPIPFILHKDKPTIIPTGIRVKIDDGWVLKLYPRSGLGFKYGLKLLNTIGIIDSDYYNSDNEGHIMLKMLHTEGEYMIPFYTGDKIMQGVFVEYGITKNDVSNETRNGGFGSTDK